MNKINLKKFINKKIDKNSALFIIGNYGAQNLGDDAILISLVNLLKNKNCQIFIPSRNPSKVVLCDSNTPLSIQTIIKYLKSDTILIGGGSIFSKYIGTLAKFIPFLIILSKLLNKKIIFISIGYSKSTPKITDYLMKITITFASYILVRDKSSYNLLKKYCKKKIFLTKDLVFYLKVKQNKLIKLSEMKKIDLSKSICFCLKPIKNKKKQDELVLKINKLIREIRKSFPKYQFLFFPFYNTNNSIENDIEFNQKIAKLNKGVLLSKNYSPREAISILGSTKLNICMRYHSIIFSILAKNKFIGISYEDKCEEILKEHKQKVFYAENLDSTKLTKEVLKLLKN